jgi:hypothetical protein
MPKELVLPQTLSGFIEWLVENHEFQLEDVIFLLGRSHRYKAEYTQYLSELDKE